MKAPKLIKCLTLVKPKQWRELMKFARISCQEGSDADLLLAYLHKHRERLQQVVVAEIQTALYPHLTTKSVSNIMSKLLAVAEQYLVYSHVTADPVQTDVILTQIYNRGGRKLQARIEPSLTTSRLLHDVYYHQYYSDNPIKYREKGKLLDRLVTTASHMQQQTMALYEVETINWGRIKQYDFSHHERLWMTDADSEIGRTIALVKRLVKDCDVEAFWQLHEQVMTMHEPALDDLQKILALYVLRGSLILWNMQKLPDNRVVGELHAYGLEKGLLVTNGRLTVLNFLNIVNTLLPLQTMAESEAFVTKWRDKVDTKDKQSLMHMAISRVAIYHEEYEKSLQHQRYIKFERPSIKARSYASNIICLFHYRKGDMTVLRAGMRNFRRYLKANDDRINRSTILAMKNLLRLISDLLLSEIKPMTIKIEDYNPIAYKVWAIKQLQKKSKEG